MNSSRLSRIALHTLAASATIGLAFGFVACKDELDPPTKGTIEIRFSSNVEGGYAGGKLYVGSDTVDVTDAGYNFIELEGTTQVRYEKECSDVSPAAEFGVDVVAGETHEVALHVDVLGGLQVTSSIAGAKIFLDGEDTGEVTPSTFSCIQGEYVVRVELFGTTDLASQKVSIAGSDGVKNVDFALEPAIQTRGALIEVLTATECPNCGPVDIAAENLWNDPEMVDAGVVSVQVHHPWAGNSDPFFTQSTIDRLSFYDSGSGLPIRKINGKDSVTGAGDGNIPRLEEAMRAEVAPYIDGQAAKVALYWMNLERVPGMQVSGTLRAMVLETIENPQDLAILGANYKHDLWTRVRIHHNQEEPFFRVIRRMEDKGTLLDLGLVDPGDWVDLDFTFSTEGDIDEASGELWTEEGMGMVGIVQDVATGSEREVFQVVHAFLP